MYAVGYFLEVGIGTTPDMLQWVFLFSPGIKSARMTHNIFVRSISYYKQAAELGDKRAAARLRSSQSQPMHQLGGPGAVLQRDEGEDIKGVRDKDCIIM
jgi:uncharacterized protein